MDSDAVLQPQGTQGGTISARTKACQQLFSLCLSPTTPRCAEWPAQWLQMRQAELNLWAYGLQALGTSKASLDYRVRDRNDTFKSACALVSNTCESELLNNGTTSSCPDADAKLSRRTENGAASVRPEGELEDEGFDFFDVSDSGSVVDSHPSESGDTHFGPQRFSIRFTITELAHFSSMMRRSGTEFRFRRADSRLVESEHLDYQEELGRSILLGSLKMDQGAPFDIELFQSSDNVHDRLTTVQKRLVRGNILRRNRIVHATKSMRSSKAPPTPGPHETIRKLLAGTVENATPSDLSKSPAAVDQPIPKIHLPAKQGPPSLVESRMTGFTAQTATEIGQHFKTDLLASKTTPSVATKVTRTGAFQDYPRCPEPISEQFIQCPYCADMLPSDYTKSVVRWKGHVAQDILPYMCVFENCSTPDEMYLTSDDLLKHVQDHHSTLQWVCSQCVRSPDRSRFSTFHTMAEWQAHTVEVHKKLVPESSLASLAKFSEARVLEPISCPLCAFSSEGLVQKTLDQHIIQHIHEFALRSLPWGTRGNDAKSVSNTRTAESDSTNSSDDALLFDDDMDYNAMFNDVVQRISRLRKYTTDEDNSGSRNLIWSQETRSEVFPRLRTLSSRFIELYDVAMLRNSLEHKEPRSQSWFLGLIRLGDMLCVTMRCFSAGRSDSVETMEKKDSWSSWRDGSSHTILSLLDELETELEAIRIDLDSHQHPKDLIIAPLCFDVPSLDDGEPFHSAPIDSTIASDGKFMVVLCGPYAGGKTRNAASYALSAAQQDPDLRVFWLDVRALGLEDATGIGQFDHAFGQIGLQLLDMEHLLGVLAIADRGAAFVEAMLQTTNAKSQERWLVILDGMDMNIEAFFSGVRLPGSPIRGTAILTTREMGLPDSLGCSQIHALPYNPYKKPGADNQFDNIYLPGDIVPRRAGRARPTNSKDPFRSIAINLIRPTPVSSPTLKAQSEVGTTDDMDLNEEMMILGSRVAAFGQTLSTVLPGFLPLLLLGGLAAERIHMALPDRRKILIILPVFDIKELDDLGHAVWSRHFLSISVVAKELSRHMNDDVFLINECTLDGRELRVLCRKGEWFHEALG
ncbi:hypothetical protein PG996_013706 [Apiospora saccharicola]|uniref:C2H2-type domain-containing protein n=1 Tax=Apiospora saccharicola TaxID=335842 RepID=A0ABR1U672_9PEZI